MAELGNATGAATARSAKPCVERYVAEPARKPHAPPRPNVKRLTRPARLTFMDPTSEQVARATSLLRQALNQLAPKAEEESVHRETHGKPDFMNDAAWAEYQKLDGRVGDDVECVRVADGCRCRSA